MKKQSCKWALIIKNIQSTHETLILQGLQEGRLK